MPTRLAFSIFVDELDGRCGHGKVFINPSSQSLTTSPFIIRIPANAREVLVQRSVTWSFCCQTLLRYYFPPVLITLPYHRHLDPRHFGSFPLVYQFRTLVLRIVLLCVNGHWLRPPLLFSLSFLLFISSATIYLLSPNMTCLHCYLISLVAINVTLQWTKQSFVFEKCGSSYQPRPKSMVPSATRGLESDRGIRTECVPSKREVVATITFLGSTTLRAEGCHSISCYIHAYSTI